MKWIRPITFQQHPCPQSYVDFNVSKRDMTEVEYDTMGDQVQLIHTLSINSNKRGKPQTAND